MPYCAHLISKCTNDLMGNTWGFIDGTYRWTSRPICYQHLCYTKFKCHEIKFQSIVTPDGMIAYLYEPFEGKHHDARMLIKSCPINVLHQLMHVSASNGPVDSLYGDLAYHQPIWLFEGVLNPIRDSLEAQFNRQMSRARIAIEWGINDIVTQSRHLNFKSNMKWLKEPIAVNYMNCAFLCIVRNCIYGNEGMTYFGAKRMELCNYVALID